MMIHSNVFRNLTLFSFMALSLSFASVESARAQTAEPSVISTLSAKAQLGASYWDSFVSKAWPRVKSYFVSNENAIKSYEFVEGEAKSDYDFDNLMDAAGFKVKEVETGFGVYPVLVTTFGHARELSNADIVYINRLLRKQRAERSTPKSYIERQIVEFVVQSEFFLGDKYEIEKVEVEILPLPKVKFVTQPKVKPYSDDTEVILKAIDRLNTKIQQSDPVKAN